MNKAYSNKQTSISSQNHAQRNRENKTRYDKLGKPIKQTSFTKTTHNHNWNHQLTSRTSGSFSS